MTTTVERKVAKAVASKTAAAKTAATKADKAKAKAGVNDLSSNTPVAVPKPVTSNITARVNEAGGLLKITLGDLRDELGFSRLGKHVLGRMAQHLTVNNLGFFPTDFLDPEWNDEPRQWQELWVFIEDGSPRAAVLRAVGNPEEFDLIGALAQLEGSGVPGNVDYSKMTAAQRLAEIARLSKA